MSDLTQILTIIEKGYGIWVFIVVLIVIKVLPKVDFRVEIKHESSLKKD